MNPMTKTYWVVRETCRFLAWVFFSYRVKHPERMIEEGPLILAVNHASFADPPLVGICSKRAVYFLGRRSLWKWPIIGPFFQHGNVIPVDRNGNDISALRQAIRRVNEGNGVVLFPEGTRTRDGRLGEAKSGIGFVIAKTGAPVLPIYAKGTFEAFPPDSKLPRRRPVTMIIGNPVRFSPEEIAAAGREDYQRFSQRVMDAIVALKNEEEETMTNDQ